MRITLLDVYWIMVIKNHYRLIAVDLSRQKELDADPKAILKNVDNDYNAIDADGTQSVFIVTILEKIRETRLIFFLKEV